MGSDVYFGVNNSSTFPKEEVGKTDSVGRGDKTVVGVEGGSFGTWEKIIGLGSSFIPSVGVGIKVDTGVGVGPSLNFKEKFFSASL